MMLSFAHPLVLPLLVALAAWAWRMRAQKANALAFPMAAICVGLPRGRADRVRRWRSLLRWTTGAMIVVALAGPRQTNARDRLNTEGIAIGLVVDVSGSMATTDFRWRGESISRLAGVRKIFKLLVIGGTTPEGIEFQGRPRDLISLVTFATRPETACPPTLDHAALVKILDSQTPRTIVSEATTNPGDALAWAIDSLRKTPARRKALVLLTDGESNVPPPALAPLQAGQIAANLKIPIYTLDALDETDTSGDADKARKTLVELARLTGGKSFKANDGASLAKAVAELDRLERERLEADLGPKYVDRSAWPASVALIAWLVVAGLGATRWRTVP